MRPPRSYTIPDGMNVCERIVKRTFDCVVAAFLLVLCSPFLLWCAIRVKCEDGGSVIFSQQRIGRLGRPFLIYKFRSMQIDAEKDGPSLFMGEENDPRTTRIGRFLRHHHLDELPQLWNVLKGDMSFVGYRPERAHYIRLIEQHDARYHELYQIRPGITSFATIYNGYTDSMEKMLIRLESDLDYLAHRSLLIDCKVLYCTVMYFLRGSQVKSEEL